MKNCKPFIKWAGGKSKLINDIKYSLPSDFGKLENVTYIEPFVGGGAVLFWMLQNYPNITRAIINDINPNLTCAYRVIKENPHLWIEFLSSIEDRYYKLQTEESRKEFYLEQREIFNHSCSNDIQKSGLFILLNRTCFNGLYRVNKKGGFNVPFGKYTNPKICDTETIIADSEALQRVEILTGDFAQTLENSSPNSLFYFDPPYRPISTTSSFTTYTKEDFNDEDQLRLGAFCKKIDSMGHYFLLRNSDPKNNNPDDNFFDDLYHQFDIRRISASRMINSKSEKRGKISEILVSNTTI